MSECIFCDILHDSSTSSVVLRDKYCWAFMDIQPVNPGHVLVIPVQHASCLAELDEQSGKHMFRMAQTVAEALRRSDEEAGDLSAQRLAALADLDDGILLRRDPAPFDRLGGE